ncbi:MAG: SDR family NAD(P)-dependent oxidoreductase [Hydrogenovibrio sp.]|uniref:SDR family NAD(P)-dependent oxidoreductase n=1 Tax=Hydrogenovibrio TaxID=28884 RepID=UPI00037429E2|nr:MULTISPECIES: SDR family NAD(P)-dependent oxidoreductase [Hydrogenovibrio]MDR9498589.1 SDR family NAD(P)-dependent oxidoreductase [Hydrogenovibrio sp.]
MPIDSKTVLITGCSSGIGYHAAVTLSRQGHKVIATCRRYQDVQHLEQQGLRAVLMDLSSTVSIHNGFSKIRAISQGRIDLLFNNAAFAIPGAVEDLSRDALGYQFDTNVFGTQELTNLVIPLMRQQGRGKIVYNSSVLGFAAMAYRGAYNASKFAIEGLADTLRLELKPANIHVSLIEPGPIRSRFRANAYEQYLRWIKDRPSAHKQNYQAMEARLENEGDAAPFTLGPEAVTNVLLKILSSPRPSARYRVTFPTKLFALLKRLLPTRWLDAILLRAGGNGRR